MVEPGDEVTVEGHDHIPDGTEAVVTAVHADRGEDYHPISVSYTAYEDEEDEEGHEYNGRVKEEHLNVDV